MNLADLVPKWELEADAMRRRGVLVNGAALCDEMIADLRNAITSEGETLLSLSQASERSGYSGDYLGRLIREGRLPNAGRKGSPRIRASHLPRKPSGLVRTGPGAYDPGADARNLLSRQRGGSNG